MKNEIEKEMDELDKVASQIEENMTKAEEKGISDTNKYFDSLHSHLMNFNNLMIAGYFTLIQMNSSLNKVLILFPLINLVLLFYIDYRMMKRSRFFSIVKSKNIDQIKNNGKYQSYTNLISLFSMMCTAAVLGVFLIQLFF